MRRILRLFACAAAMLVVAVGVAALLKDEPGYESGRSEISGKLVGLTKYQEGREEAAAETAAQSGQEQKETALPLASGPAEDRPGSTSAPFDTRPGSIALEKPAEDASAGVAERGEKKNGEVAKTPSSTESLPLNKSGKSVSVEEKGHSPSQTNDKTEKTSSREDRRETAFVPAAQDRTDESTAERDRGPASKDAGEEAPVAGTEKSGQQFEREVTSAKFSMQGSQIKLTLQGNAPMVGHYFALGNPSRIVLDLAGNWSIDVPRVPSNRLVQAVRVGQHDDKTRLVFDLKTEGKAALVPLNRNSLELRIQ